jgi:predicted AlkP superfamily phosphohydrolase/phosphomutase
MSKLIIVGLDGATFDLIVPWVEAGKLQTFKRFLEDGTWGELQSTFPPLTCPAWPCFMTGKNPGKFGMNDFVIQAYNGERVVNFSDVAGEPFWDTAGRDGHRCLVVNVPVTYPPRIVNGILLSGMMTPPGKPFWSDPEALEHVKKSGNGYVVDLDILTLNSLNREKSLRKLYDMMDNRFRLIRHLMKAGPFDLAVVVFRAPDIVCHRLWDRQDVILHVYEMIDQYLKVLVNEEANLFLMSDHGFGAFPKGIRINQYLYDLGVLVRRKAEFGEGSFHGAADVEKEKFGSEAEWVYRVMDVPLKVFLRLGITRTAVADILQRMGLYGPMRKRLPRVARRAFPISKFVVDRVSSKAYLDSRRTRGITINRDRCDRAGYSELKESIKQGLLALRDPESGGRVVRRVLTREEVYHGEYVGRFPDLYVEPEEDYSLRDDFGEEIVYRFAAPRPNHKSRGIFAAYGPDIAPGKKIEGMDISDIAPTALHLLGVPVPEDMDGQVVKGVFKSESEAFARGRTYASPVEGSVTTEGKLSGEDEAAIKASLKALGYMD